MLNEPIRFEEIVIFTISYFDKSDLRKLYTESAYNFRKVILIILLISSDYVIVI